MRKIQRLSPVMVSKIAAGEVIERPASVVKELVENSLDANASRIEVDIDKGGLKIVRVVDNGEGMEEDDALAALEEYSTSKISSLEDLCFISTLGFRGEALHAISSVSRLLLFTSTGGLGTVVKAEGGLVKGVAKRPRAKGTTVEVRDLFFNLRARRKFLRSPATEMGHVLQLMKEYVLAYPQVHFVLRENDKVFIDYPSGSLIERAAALWSIAEDAVLEIELQGDGVILEGCLANPASLIRKDAKGIFFFVNGRPVKDRLLVTGLVRGLRHRLPRGEYPLCALFLKLSAEDVDVNVHPSKREVKFRRPQEVARLLQEGISSVLDGRLDEKRTIFAPSGERGLISDRMARISGSSYSFHGSHGFSRVCEERMDLGTPFWRFLGEYAGVFLLLEVGDDLVLVDKHALHERMIYDVLMRQDKAGKAGRLLLVPLEVFLEPGEAECIAYLAKLLEKLGFILTLKGEDSCEIRGVPSWFKGDVVLFVRALLEQGEVVAEEEMRERIASLACREAIKAGDSLEFSEVERLLNHLDFKGMELTCPHGRPVVVRLSRAEVDRLFKRRV